MKVPQLPNYAKKIKRNIYKKMKNNITKYYHIIIEENNISEAYIFYTPAGELDLPIGRFN